MTRSRFRLLMASMLLVFAMFVAACGGGEDDGGGDGGASPATPAAEGADDNAEALEFDAQRGGRLTMLAASDVDFLDPGHTYYTAGFQVLLPTHRPLYSFHPDNGDVPRPDLAESEPEISEDKKTVTVKIREGVRFAPPVNRDVTSDDVKYAFERFFSANVGGQYPGFFTVIEGAPSEPTKGVKPISGIQTPDDQTIVFKLKEPTAVSFAQSLVLPISAPVPRDFAKKFDAENPSTYNTHVIATGPYMVKNNDQGETIGYSPGKSIELVRNPNWDGEAQGDFRPAYLDSVFIRTNATDANVAARQVIEGENMVLDTNPPANILRDLVTEIKDQYMTIGAGTYRYFPLNTTVEPFDDINVRKAVLAGFDRDAARKARGGEYVGPIATHFLPPDFPGFTESGGLEGFGFDFLANPEGDMEVAAKYMRAAGYQSGKYEGDEELLLVGANADPGKAQSEVARAQLEKLGFKVRLRLVPQDAVYTEWCQVPAKNVAMCGGAAWAKDFADPQSMLEPLFKGELIAEKGNINYSELNDPKIDAAMERAALLEGQERLEAWAEVNEMIVASAAAVPFVWDQTTLVRSKNVNGVANPYNALWDFSFTSIKPAGQE